MTSSSSHARLQAENEDLRYRLEEAEETLRAIRSGAVDAVVVEEQQGHRIYTLEGADKPYRLLVEQMQQGALTLDANGAIVYCNRRFAEMLGVAHGKLIDRALRDFIPHSEGARYEALLSAAQTGGGHGEASMLRADGTELPVVFTLNVLPADSGAAVGVLVTDLTAQRDRERLDDALAALRLSEERFRHALMEIAIPTLLHAEDDEILLVNKVWTEITGYQHADIPTIADWTTRAYGSAHQSADDVITEMFDAPARVDNGIWKVTTTGGDSRAWHFYTTPVGRDPSGRRLLVSNAIDVTERQQMEHELRLLAADLSEANRRKDEFLATLAHELRNPLAPIRNALEIMRRAAGDATLVEQARQIAERQLLLLIRLVDDLLDVSRITSGKIELRRQRVDLASVVQSAIETTQVLMDAAGHSLAVRLPAEPVWLDADSARLAQVLSNLLNNAAKYTVAPGRIELTAKLEAADDDGSAESIAISVRDTGIGIQPEMLPRIFDLFTQAEDALQRAQGGLGIGLTLVKRLVHLHGGSIDARSEGLGRGSEFVIHLPLTRPSLEGAAGDAPSKPEQRSLAMPPTAVSARRVLVVDDNTDAAETLAELLMLMGHEVRLAHDGPTALQMAKTFQPDALLLDVGLPAMNGYEVARRIRADADLAGMLLIAVTGWSREDDRGRTADAGFDHHVAKPADPDVLRRWLGAAKRRVR